MSRIGKKPVKLEKGVTVKLNDRRSPLPGRKASLITPCRRVSS